MKVKFVLWLTLKVALFLNLNCECRVRCTLLVFCGRLKISSEYNLMRALNLDHILRGSMTLEIIRIYEKLKREKEKVLPKTSAATVDQINPRILPR